MIRLVKASKLNGKKIVGNKGRIIGEVEGIDIDFDTWQIKGLQVGLTNDAALEAGFKRPMLSQIVIFLPPHLIKNVSDMIMLKESVENLKDLVKYKGFR